MTSDLGNRAGSATTAELRTAAALRWQRPLLTAELAGYACVRAVADGDDLRWMQAAAWLVDGHAAGGDARDVATAVLGGLTGPGRPGDAVPAVPARPPGAELLSRPEAARLRVELATVAQADGELTTARTLVAGVPDDAPGEEPGLLRLDRLAVEVRCALAEQLGDDLDRLRREVESCGAGFHGDASAFADLVVGSVHRARREHDLAVARALRGLAELGWTPEDPAARPLSAHLAAALLSQWITALLDGGRSPAEAVRAASAQRDAVEAGRQGVLLRLTLARADAGAADQASRALTEAAAGADTAGVPALVAACRTAQSELHEGAGRYREALEAMRSGAEADQLDRDRARRFRHAVAVALPAAGLDPDTRRHRPEGRPAPESRPAAVTASGPVQTAGSRTSHRAPAAASTPGAPASAPSRAMQTGSEPEGDAGPADGSVSESPGTHTVRSTAGENSARVNGNVGAGWAGATRTEQADVARSGARRATVEDEPAIDPDDPLGVSGMLAGAHVRGVLPELPEPDDDVVVSSAARHGESDGDLLSWAGRPWHGPGATSAADVPGAAPLADALLAELRGDDRARTSVNGTPAPYRTMPEGDDESRAGGSPKHGAADRDPLRRERDVDPTSAADRQPTDEPLEARHTQQPQRRRARARDRGVGEDRISEDRISEDRIGGGRIGADRIGEDRIGDDRIDDDRDDRIRGDRTGDERTGRDRFGRDGSGAEQLGPRTAAALLPDPAPEPVDRSIVVDVVDPAGDPVPGHAVAGTLEEIAVRSRRLVPPSGTTHTDDTAVRITLPDADRVTVLLWARSLATHLAVRVHRGGLPAGAALRLRSVGPHGSEGDEIVRELSGPDEPAHVPTAPATSSERHDEERLRTRTPQSADGGAVGTTVRDQLWDTPDGAGTDHEEVRTGLAAGPAMAGVLQLPVPDEGEGRSGRRRAAHGAASPLFPAGVEVRPGSGGRRRSGAGTQPGDTDASDVGGAPAEHSSGDAADVPRGDDPMIAEWPAARPRSRESGGDAGSGGDRPAGLPEERAGLLQDAENGGEDSAPVRNGAAGRGATGTPAPEAPGDIGADRRLADMLRAHLDLSESPRGTGDTARPQQDNGRAGLPVAWSSVTEGDGPAALPKRNGRRSGAARRHDRADDDDVAAGATAGAEVWTLRSAHSDAPRGAAPEGEPATDLGERGPGAAAVTPATSTGGGGAAADTSPASRGNGDAGRTAAGPTSPPDDGTAASDDPGAIPDNMGLADLLAGALAAYREI